MVVTLDHVQRKFVLYLHKVQKRKKEDVEKKHHTIAIGYIELFWIKIAGNGTTAGKLNLEKGVRL